MKKLHEGEIVGNGAGVVTTRIAVAGGWLYTTAAGVGVAHAFVPDPDADHCQPENVVALRDGWSWRRTSTGWSLRGDDDAGSLDRDSDTDWRAFGGGTHGRVYDVYGSEVYAMRELARHLGALDE